MTLATDPPITTSDPWLEQERRDLTAFCRRWLAPDDERLLVRQRVTPDADGWLEATHFLREVSGGQGSEHYRFSLTPAAALGLIPVHGGAQDRRYRVACTEADLHLALASLAPMYRRFGHLWRQDRWTATLVWDWDRLLGAEFGQEWIEFRDAWLNAGEERTYKLRLSKVFNAARQLTAERMADCLGEGWLAA